MVPLTGRGKQAQGRELEAPISAYRAAVAALPSRDAPLIDRLFTLECLARAGRDARAQREQLLPARRTAEDYIEREWEPDVPHVHVLGQALATIAALDDDPPWSWANLLDETLADLEHRQSKFGVGSVPLVLASVVRGLATTGAQVPNWLLDAVRAYFEKGPTAVVAAELADALSRHSNATTLTQRAAETVFGEHHSGDPGVAIARWWLAERLKGTLDGIATDDKIATARAQALMSGTPDDPRLAAMLAEITARAVESLVLLPASELEVLRARSRGRALVENYLWRTLAVLVPVVLAILFIETWLGWLGNDNPSAKALAGLTALLVGFAAYVVMVAVESIVRCLGRETPPWLNQAQIFVPIAVGAIAFFLHS